MAAADDDDSDVILLVHQLPVDMDGPDEGRLAHLLPPLHRAPPPPPPPPFRPPPPPQAVASAEHRLSFRGWLGAPRHWEVWVAKLRPLHAPLWRRLGIHDAVVASTYRIKPDASHVLHLASFWSPDTSTFAFPWGEATLTLHDVAVIAGLPSTGSPVPAPLQPEWRPDEAALNGVRLGFNRSACKKAHLSAWIKHFLTEHNDTVLEHAAFLALWLTRFVLPGHPDSTMRQAVFPIAVRLARGERVALAPAVLASLYRDLRDIKAFLIAAGAAATTGNADMLSSLSLYSPLYLLHLWIWERFPKLRPGRENQLGDGEPMGARWHDLSRKANPTLIREVLSSRDNFLWQLPCATALKKYSGWVCSSDITENDELRLLAHCLRPCELVGMDCIEQYLPHRVARQFGLDQDVPMDVRRANQDWVVAWQTYELEGKNVSLFIPESEPGITARYAQWWRQQVQPSDTNAGALSIPLESKGSKRKVKKTLAAMEAEAEKERRMKKARVSPSDKKRKLEELYDPKFSGWLAAGRSGISDAAGSSCKKGSLSKYDMGSDEALLPNVGATNDDVVLLLPRMQTASPAVVVPKKDDIMNPDIGDVENSSPAVAVPKKDDIMNPDIGDVGNSSPAVVVPKKDDIMNPDIGDVGNSIVDMPPEISTNELDGGATAMQEETLNNPVGRPLDITDRPEGDTLVMKSEKEAMEISVTRSLGIHRPEGATLVMELEKEAMETHNTPEDDTTEVSQLGYEKLRDVAPIEDDTKEKSCADDKDLAEKDVDESTEVCKVKQDKGEGCDLLMENYSDNIADALGEGHDLLIEKDSANNTDALGVEPAAEGQATSLTKEGIHDHVEEITVVEQLDEQSERATRIGVEDITEEITKAHEKEHDNDTMTDSKKLTDSEMLCSSATVQFKGGMMEKQCIHNVVLNNQRELSSECNAAAMKVEGIYDHRTMDMEELALTQKYGHKIIDENKATATLERSHMLDSVVPDLIILEVDEIHTAGGIQNQGILNLEKEKMVPKQKQDHRIIWENKETMVSEGSHMLDSRVESNLVTLETDETHAGGGIQHQEILGLDMEMALKQKQDHIIACKNKETTELQGIHMLDSSMKSDLVTLEVDKTPAEGNENQDILDVNKQQGMSGTQDLGTAIENYKMNMSEDEDIPVCSGYQIGPTIESTKTNMSEDAGIPNCSDQIDPSGIEVNEVEFTKRLQNQELLDNREQPAMEEGQHLETIIENSKINLPNEADVLVCGEHQIDSNQTANQTAEVAEVKSSSVILNQELSDKKEDQVTEKRMACETAYEDGVPLEEAYKLGDRVDTCVVAVNVSDSTLNKETFCLDRMTEKRMECEIAYESRISLEEAYKLGGADTCGVAVNVSDSMQNKATCTTEEAMEDKQHHGVEHVNKERILEDTTMIDSSELKSDATHVEVDMAGSKEGTQDQHATDVEVDMAGSKEGTQDQHATDVEVDMAGSKEGTLNQHATDMEADIAGSKEETLNQHATDVEADIAGSKEETLNQYALSEETVAAMQEKQDQEMAGEDTNKDVADVNALECEVKPDEAVVLFHETLLTTQSVSSEDKENAPSFEEHNITEVAGFESNQTTLVDLEGALPLETKNVVEVEQENLESETERSIFRENDEVSCKDQASACIMISPSNVDDQCDDDNGWAEEPTKSNDKLASDSINTSNCNPIKVGKSSNEEVKRAQNIRSMYLKDIKESLGRIRAEPLNRVQPANFGYPSRHAVQESHSACKEIKVPSRDSGRDFVRDRALELVVTSPAEESSRWRQEQYALQILEDVQNARIAEKTRMEMEIRILKAQIASMERQVMNLDHFSEVRSRSKRH